MPTKHSSQALYNEYLEICIDMHFARPLPQNFGQVPLINLQELLEVLRANKASLPLRVVVNDDILVVDGLEHVADVPVVEVVMLGVQEELGAVFAEVFLDVVGSGQQVQRCHELSDHVLLLLWRAKLDQLFVGGEDEVVDLSVFAQGLPLDVLAAEKRLKVLLALQRIAVSQVPEVLHNERCVFESGLVVKVEPLLAAQVYAIVAVVAEDIDDSGVVFADVLSLRGDLENLGDVFGPEALLLLRVFVEDVLEDVHH